MPKICPKCGALDSQREFVGAFCIKCFSESAQLFELPRNPELRQCSSCKRVFLNNEWTELDEQKLEEWLLQKIKTKIAVVEIKAEAGKSKNGLLVEAQLFFQESGHEIVRKTSFLLRLKPGNCGDCLKKSGGYHEAVIQLRGENKSRLKKLAEFLVKKVSGKSFVSGMEEKREGIDLLVGDRGTAMQAVQQTGRRFTVAHKLIGVRHGKRVYRASICIRI